MNTFVNKFCGTGASNPYNFETVSHPSILTLDFCSVLLDEGENNIFATGTRRAP